MFTATREARCQKERPTWSDQNYLREKAMGFPPWSRIPTEHFDKLTSFPVALTGEAQKTKDQ
jgi:hypothetical protein